MNTAFGQYSSVSVADGGKVESLNALVADTVFHAVAIDTAETLESARTQALSQALGQVLRFYDAEFVRLSSDATDAQCLENYSIQTETYIQKAGEGYFVARVVCVAERKAVSKTFKMTTGD